MRAFQLLAASAVTVVVAHAAHAQGPQHVLQPGARILVTIPDAVPHHRGPVRPVQVISGEITRVTSDSVYLRPAPRVGELAIPFAAVERLKVSRGAPRRTSSALVTGVQQSIGFAILGALLYNAPGRQFGVNSSGEAAALGAGVGFLGGALVGAIAPFERWKRVEVPGRQ